MGADKTNREKKQDGNGTIILRVILNEFWKYHPSKQQLNSHLVLISKTIQDNQGMLDTLRSKNELISDVLQWTFQYVGRPARTYLQLFSADSGHSLEDLP